jgi:tRNA threonylcarbamoyladenosine biosynthesis protein TsaE
MQERFNYHINDIAHAAHYILQNIGTNKIICFEAAMGAGKTTLITEICKQLNVIDLPSSPTFSIINEYKTIDNQSIYHLDLYRIRDEEELLQAGVEEVLYSGNYCFVEWPKIAKNIVPSDVITFYIEILNEQEREIVLTNNSH